MWRVYADWSWQLALLRVILLMTVCTAEAAELNTPSTPALKHHAQFKPPLPVKHLNILTHAEFALHDPGTSHPEQAERVTAIIQRLKQDPRLQPLIRWPTFGAASREDLLRVHTPAYLQLLEREQALVTPGGQRQLSTGDTVLSEQSLAVATLASGAALAAVDSVMQAPSSFAWALTRPPGHHASQDRGMGFCLLNHVAIAARYAQHHYGIQRILIVDIDVHHGNGTQAIFYQDPSVFYFSAHQHPLYPGTGNPRETGAGAGVGTTLNLALAPGADASALLTHMQTTLWPAMQRFRPELILVSAGLDAHVGDRLGGLAYTDQDYAEIATLLQAMAAECSLGRMVWVLEGGYVPRANADAVQQVLYRLSGLDH